MKINIKSLQGDEYVIEVQSDQLVSELKASISEKASGLAKERQKLVYKGRTLQESSRLKDYSLEDGCKVHLIIMKENSAPSKSSPASDTRPLLRNDETCPMETAATTTSSTTTTRTSTTTDQPQNTSSESHSSDVKRELSRFEILLRERLAAYFSKDAVDKIMVNLEHEINADINSSSLDDLERLAKQKLNISNE